MGYIKHVKTDPAGMYKKSTTPTAHITNTTEFPPAWAAGLLTLLRKTGAAGVKNSLKLQADRDSKYYI